MAHFLGQVPLIFALSMICFSMNKHHKKVFTGGLTSAQRSKLKLAGWFIIVMSYFFVAGRIGWGEGFVIWMGHVTLAALLVIAIVSNIDIMRAKIMRRTDT